MKKSALAVLALLVTGLVSARAEAQGPSCDFTPHVNGTAEARTFTHGDKLKSEVVCTAVTNHHAVPLYLMMQIHIRTPPTGSPPRSKVVASDTYVILVQPNETVPRVSTACSYRVPATQPPGEEYYTASATGIWSTSSAPAIDGSHVVEAFFGDSHTYRRVSDGGDPD